MSAALVLAGAGAVTLSVDQSAVALRDEAVAVARMILEVTDETLEAAVESVRELKTIAKNTEESRKAIKKPIDAIAAKIQDTALRSKGVFDGEQKIGAGLTVFWEDVAQVRV